MRRLSLAISLLCLLTAAIFVSPAHAVDGGAPSQNSGYGMGGGGGGGSFFWYELVNLDHRLNWPAVSELKSYDDATAEYQYKPLTKKVGNEQCEVSHSSATCPFWYDTKQTGSNPGSQEFHTTAPVPKDIVSPNIVVAYNIRIWRYDYAAGDSHGEAGTPIFERQVGLGGGDSDPASKRGIPDSWWWRGGDSNGKLWTAAGAQGGPVSMSDQAMLEPCRARFDNARNPKGQMIKTPRGFSVTTVYRPGSLPSDGCYWEGSDFDGGRALPAWTQKRDGRVVSGCSNLSKSDRCVRESLTLDPNITTNDRGTPELNYKLTGKPGVFYAVQIVALDNRERIMPVVIEFAGSGSSVTVLHDDGTAETTSTGSAWDSLDEGATRTADNYFRVWQPTKTAPATCTPSPCNPPCDPDDDDAGDDTNCPPVTTTPTPANEPHVNVSLNSPTTLLTRQEAGQTISTETAYTGSDQDRQAAYVKTVSLQHFTPQLTYDGARTGSADAYNKQYVSYDSDPGAAARNRPAATMGPVSNPDATNRSNRYNASPPGVADMLYIAKLSQAPKQLLDPDQTQNDYHTTWERPTLTNPCTTGLSSTNMTGSWPVNSQTCQPATEGVALRQAWDDIFNASVSFETRMASVDSNKEDLGVINDQHLRCDDKITVEGSANDDGSVKTPAGRPISQCGQTRHSLQPLPKSEDQTAQGYIVAKGKRSSGDAAVNVNLGTNRPDLTQPWSLINRGTGEYGNQIAAGVQNSYATPNTMTGQPEGWFCTPGVPGPKGGIAVHLNDAPNDGAGTDVKDGDKRIGDDLNGNSGSTRRDCQGWALAWNWDSQDEWGFDEDHWTDTSINACQPDMPGPTGAAGQFPIDWPDDASLNAAGGRGTYTSVKDIPYAGRRPGTRWGSTKDCAVYLEGNYTRGTWQYSYQWVQNPDQPVFCNWKDAGSAMAAVAGGPGGANALPCSSKSWKDADGQSHPWYRLGYWYRTSASIAWDTTSCDYTAKGKDQSVTSIGGGSSSNFSLGTGYAPVGPNFIVDGPTKVNKFTQPMSEPCWDLQPGHIYTGNWRIAGVESGQDFSPGYGWGVNNSGPRLPEGGYLFSFPFRAMDPATAATVNWDMTANYEGHREWTWRTNWRTNNPEGTSVAVRVFSPRGTR